MRLSNQNLKDKYYPYWNDERHDIGAVLYGDTPLKMWNKDYYKEYSKLTGSLANIEAVEAYIYNQYGDYSLYRLIIGEIYISDGQLKEVLCGNMIINHHWISLNLMHGLVSLTITKSNTLDVIGFRTQDGIHSSRLKKNTRELKPEQIKKVLNSDISDYGESVHKFMKACKDVYERYPENYILEDCFGENI